MSTFWMVVEERVVMVGLVLLVCLAAFVLGCLLDFLLALAWDFIFLFLRGSVGLTVVFFAEMLLPVAE